MKFLRRLFKKSLGQPMQNLLEGAYGYSSYTGKVVTPQSAMQLTAVFSCVRVLSESVGMLPCALYRVTKAGREKASSTKLHSLLSVAPNNYMTPQEFWELIMVCLCLRGNFYAYKNKVSESIIELLPIDPDKVEAKLSDNWEPEYKVSFGQGRQETLTQDEIWHVRIFSTNGLNGLSPISHARQAIGLGLATEEHGSRLFSNGTVASGVLKTDSQLTDAAYNRLKSEFEERHSGLSNAYKPMILEMGLDWKQISLTAEDAQFLETRKFQLEEICRIFRVPMHLVQNTDRGTFNNIENLGMSFINYALVPYLTRIEQRINIGLVDKKERGKYYAKFNAGALLRGDLQSRYRSYSIGINWGILSPNECRELEELDPRADGDIYLTPMNMTTNAETNNNDQNKTTA